jgi:hypothetical protein
VLPIKKGLKCFQANENVCGFCLLNYWSEKSVKRCDCICCKVCRTWYHVLRAGALGTFTCGKCVWSKLYHFTLHYY